MTNDGTPAEQQRDKLEAIINILGSINKELETIRKLVQKASGE